MSYDVQFCDPVTGECIVIDDLHFIRGGTYALGGTNELTLNITVNYYKIFESHSFDVKDLDGVTALDAVPVLNRVIAELGDDVDADYWKPTEGNAKRALVGVLTLAKMRPDAVIKVSY